MISEPEITIAKLAQRLAISQSAIKKQIEELKDQGRIKGGIGI
jgi:biotin operon repressor